MKRGYDERSERRKHIGLFITLIWFSVIVYAGQAGAGGLYINEFGTSSMGTAGAGSQAWANDASTSFHNPAGMTRIEGKEFMVTGGLIYSKIKFDPAPNTPIPGGDGGDAGALAPLLGAFYTHSITDDLLSTAGAMDLWNQIDIILDKLDEIADKLSK